MEAQPFPCPLPICENVFINMTGLGVRWNECRRCTRQINVLDMNAVFEVDETEEEEEETPSPEPIPVAEPEPSEFVGPEEYKPEYPYGEGTR